MWPWNTRHYRDPAPNAAAPAVTNFTTVRAGQGAVTAPHVPSDAQTRLSRLETMLADHARSEGRAPHGSVEQQLAEVLDRLHEQSKQDV